MPPQGANKKLSLFSKDLPRYIDYDIQQVSKLLDIFLTLKEKYNVIKRCIIQSGNLCEPKIALFGRIALISLLNKHEMNFIPNKHEL